MQFVMRITVHADNGGQLGDFQVERLAEDTMIEPIPEILWAMVNEIVADKQFLLRMQAVQAHERAWSPDGIKQHPLHMSYRRSITDAYSSQETTSDVQEQ